MRKSLMKRFIACFLTVCMTVCMSPAFAFATDVDDGEENNVPTTEMEDKDEIDEPADAVDNIDGVNEDEEASDEELDAASYDDEVDAELSDEEKAKLLEKPFIAVINRDHEPEIGDYDYTFIYCEANHDLEEDVDNIYYYDNSLELYGYNGKSIIINGGNQLDNLTIDVEKASTITCGVDSEAAACIMASNIDITLKGAGKLTLNGTKIKYAQFDQEEVSYEYDYPDGIVVLDGDLTLRDINIASKNNNYGIMTTGDFYMKGGILVTTYNKICALEAKTIELCGGTMTSGYSVKTITPTDAECYEEGTYPWQTIAKSGVIYGENGYNKYVGKNITVKGGHNVVGEFGEFRWSLNSKGVLTVNGLGELDYLKDEEGEDDYDNVPWNEYDYCIKSIVLGDGITSIEDDVFYKLYKAKSISLPATLTHVEKWHLPYSLTEIKVNKANPEYTSVSGVLFNKNKTRLIAYPESKTTKSYAIPEGVKVIGEYAFSWVALKSLQLPKSLETIEEGALRGDTLKTITVKKGNSHFSVSKGVLYADNGKTLMWYSPGNASMSYTVADGITKIGDDAFFNYNLRAVYLPASVEYVGDDAFDGWRLYDVFFRGDAPEIDGYLSSGNVIVTNDSNGWDKVKEDGDYNIIKCDDIDNYYPSEIHFDKDVYEMDVLNYYSDDEFDYDGRAINVTLCSDSGNDRLYNYTYNVSSKHLYVDNVYDEDSSFADGDTNVLSVNHDDIAGTYKITATLPNGVSCSCNVKVNPLFAYDDALVYVGQKGENELIGVKGTIKWSSSDTTIATVDRKGKVTGKKVGDCKIKAVWNGNTYEYNLRVRREKPGYQYASSPEYSSKYNCIYVTVYNRGDTNLVVYSSGARFEDPDNPANNRQVKMTSSSVTIKPWGSKKLTFKVVGSKISDFDEKSADIYTTMSLNGIKYPACITSDSFRIWFDYQRDDPSLE